MSPQTTPSTASNQHHPNTHTSSRSSTSATIFLASVVALLAAAAIAVFFGNEDTAGLFRLRRFFGGGVASSRSSSILRQTSPAVQGFSSSALAADEIKMRTPVYFLSHGGPNVMYQVDHPAYKRLGQIGREITTKVKPRAVVVFSAHWQASQDTIQVNTAEITDLIYDFYGFPGHYYKEKYPNVGSAEVAKKVLDALGAAGIKAKGVKRGLDHGVWASFKCAFEPDENPLNVPIVQVSLFKTEDPVQHYRLGQAVSHLRDDNILIIASGMAVHNLRDMMFSFGDPRPLPYTASFDEALKDAVTSVPEDREKAMAELLKRPDARQAHPYFDHLLPIHIGAGAAGEDRAKRLWTLGEGSMSWAQYRFGEVANSSGSL
ncbi:DODA-type extradiol aromatic ring-opening family dioxygenase [Aspergillus chevalieri]|uniref:Extradiol ring-cleavage dioxygenase class III enzyme subunit B domain-containing protein n=1 Tax=Aspergillus chevalieri TaxID=182096 RepID=A0A7R7ZP97_ASPCH|nr:uncharacterized protein ACHE_50888S [Aspergillus chevalieri]BCR89690.1 hypothetical protein ACHE_50888S [Aspergillus chevalieri]